MVRSIGFVIRRGRNLLTPLFLALLLLPLLAQAQEVIRIGVLAKRGAEHTRTKWAPTAEYLSTQIPDHRFEIVPLSFEEVIPSVINKDIQFILANPSFYVELEVKYGASRIVTLINNCNDVPCTMFGGVLFTRADSGVRRVSELEGKHLMAVKETSLGGYQVARQVLEQHKLDLEEDLNLSFGQTHDSVVYAVLEGRADAGVVRTDTLERMAREERIDIRDIRVLNPQRFAGFDYRLSTKLYPEWPLARLAHTSREHSDAVAAALLVMPSTHEAARASHSYGWTVPSNYQSVHELLKELKLGPYLDFSHITLGEVLWRYWHWLLLTGLAFAVLALFNYRFRNLNRRLRIYQGELELARDTLTQSVIERTTDLLSSKAQLEAIFNAQPDAFVFADSERTVRMVNPAFVEEFGYQDKEVIGEKSLLLYAAEEEPQLREPDPDVPMGVTETEMYEVCYRRKDGSTFIGETLERAIVGQKGETLGYIGVIRDITERTKAERALRASEQMNRAIHSAALDGIVTIDHEGMLLDFNPAAERTFGYLRQDIIGQSMAEKIIPPAMRTHHYAGFKHYLETSDSNIINRRIETNAMRADGSEFPVELAITGFELDHKPVFTAYIRDIAERRRHEQLLIKNEARLAEAQRIAHVGSWDWDIERNTLHWSDETYRIFGLQPQELVINYDAFLERIYPDDRAMVAAVVENALEQRRAYSIDHRILRNDGSTRYVHEQGEASYDHAGNPVYMVGTVQDITERKQIEEDLLLAATSFETHEAIMITDVAATILRVNQAFTVITGYESNEVLGKTPQLLSSGCHEPAFFHQMWYQITETDRWSGEIWNRRKNGEIYPEWLTITAVRNKENETTHFVAHFQDITARKAAESKIKRQAYYDALTELPNRRLLNDRIQQSLLRAARRQYAGAVIFLDLDHFKVINDSLGHHIGDLVVQEVAQRLVTSIREEDTAARLGGDEFVILLPELADEMEEAFVEAQLVVGKLQAAVSRPIQVMSHELHITASMGIALFPEGHESVEDVLRQADIAMYRAKDMGRSTYQFYLPSMQLAASERLVLEQDLRRALATEELMLYYQPQISNNGDITGAECLIRWRHAERGFVPPSDFIPVAEDTGLILELGEWVITEACTRLAGYLQHDICHTFERLAINVSPKQFQQQDFVERLKRIVEKTGVDPNRLELEFTEGMLISQVDETIHKINELKALGVHFSIDDFGTGYSSLTYLRKLPVDKLKIDQSFVRHISSDPSDAAIVDTIIAMSRHLALNVIAEGVETAEQLSFLKEKGCERYQGNLFYQPLPRHEFEQLLGLRSD